MFEWIQTFLVVYETQNFSIAAERLFISQPTVSSQIKKLEERLEIQLFLRNGKQKITATKEADFLYPKFLAVMNELFTSVAQAAKKDNFKENCVIACSHTTAIYLLPKVMKSLVETFPLIDFSINMMNSNEVASAVQTGHADIGLLEKPLATNDIRKEIILEDQLVLAGDAESTHWLIREEDSGIRFFNELYLNEFDLHPQIIYVNNNELLLQLIREGVGKSIVSSLSITEDMVWQPLGNFLQKRDIFIVAGHSSTNSMLPEVYDWLKHKLKTFFHEKEIKSIEGENNEIFD